MRNNKLYETFKQRPIETVGGLALFAVWGVAFVGYAAWGALTCMFRR